MIVAVARLWPHHAFWLATGITDAANGHIAPMTALTFPERFYGEEPWARAYFRMSLQLAERLYALGEIDLSDDSLRTAAIERERPRAHWVGGRLVDIAYELADTDEYGQLVAAWEEREKGRVAQLERIQGNRPWERTQKKRHGDAVLGGDPRTAHQSSWDLFYKSQPDQDDAGE